MDDAARPEVAFFLPTLEGGGAERVTVDIAAAVAADRPVELVVARGGGALAGDVPATVPIVDLGAARTVTSVTSLARYLRDRRPTGLVSALSHANVVAAAARALARSPARLLLVEHVDLTRHTAGSSSLRDRALPRVLRPIYRRHAVAAVSAGVAADVEDRVGLARGTVRVAPNPVLRDRLEAKAAEPVDHPWLAAKGGPVALAVGRLVRQKDFATLLDAVAAARRTQPDLRLVVLGEGPERAALERRVAELGLDGSVSLPGFVANPYPSFRAADVLVLSSRWEGLPTVLLEALALGLPVVATDCPSGPAEVLDGGRYGRLAPVEDGPALGAAIVETLTDGRPAPDPSEACARFDPAVVAARYAELLGLPPSGRSSR